ncbi:MAG TPA: glycolate oxidase subunit GlcF [Acidimicrobiales bacterium]|nr:glycolate oxidase subunit GlcF [Acidimicrobiales bacterium]
MAVGSGTTGHGAPAGATPAPIGFDGHHPPERALVRDCVHCGFCLPSCPTYVIWGEEMDSPRGRIHLMEQLLDGAELGPAAVEHFDRCLSCMACVSACPSGVQYDKLIEATRAQVERRAPRSRSERVTRGAVFALFPYPRRLRVARAALVAAERIGLRSFVRSSAGARLVPGPLRRMEAIAPRCGPVEHLTRRVRAQGTRRGTVGLLTGCVQRVFFSEVNAATARVLAAEGFEVVVPPAQGCCGALSGHAGREDEALRFARSTIDAFDDAGVDTVVVNAAGCGSAMKEYAHLLRDDPAYAQRARAFSERTRDVTELLVAAGPVATRHSLHGVVAYQDACHLAHAQQIRDAPRALLGGIPGLELRPLAEAELCCGSAGVYNLLEEEAATELGDRKAAIVAAAEPELLVSANPGCLMQISAALARRGATVPVAHLIQVLDASLRAAPLPGSQAYGGGPTT